MLARYRALGAEARARHTHRAYLDAELGKAEAKLTRVRQGGPDALACWNRALDGIATEEEARRLLDALDAAIRAAEDRLRALGLPPVDHAAEDGVAPLSFAAAAGASRQRCSYHPRELVRTAGRAMMYVTQRGCAWMW